MSRDHSMCSWIKDKFFSDNGGSRRKKPVKPEQIPDGFTADDIRVEASICTGEKTVGFYDAEEKRLRYAELIRTDDDIAEFYAKYGLA